MTDDRFTTRLSREHALDLAQTAGTLEALADDTHPDVPDYVRRAAARCRQRVEDVLAAAQTAAPPVPPTGAAPQGGEPAPVHDAYDPHRTPGGGERQ